MATNQLWVADITYVRLAEAFVYLAVVLDAFSRKVVGWAMADHLRASLALDALEMALASREVIAGSLVHHSDRGIQYACGDYIARLEAAGIQPSMSRAGCPYDNAMAESFMKTLKREEVDASAYRDLAHASAAIGANSSRPPTTAKGSTRLLPTLSPVGVRSQPAPGCCTAARGYDAAELSVICCLAQGVQLQHGASINGQASGWPVMGGLSGRASCACRLIGSSLMWQTRRGGDGHIGIGCWQSPTCVASSTPTWHRSRRCLAAGCRIVTVRERRSAPRRGAVATCVEIA